MEAAHKRVDKEVKEEKAQQAKQEKADKRKAVLARRKAAAEADNIDDEVAGNSGNGLLRCGWTGVSIVYKARQRPEWNH